MFVLSNSYLFKTDLTDIFSILHNLKTSINCLASLDNMYFYSVKNDLYVLKNNSIKKISSLKAAITCITAHQSLICVGTMDGEVQVFSEHKTAIRRFKNHNASVNDIFIDDKNILVSSSKDYRINFYDIAQDKLLKFVTLKSEGTTIISDTEFYYVLSRDISRISKSDFELSTIYSHKSLISKGCITSGNILFASQGSVFVYNIETETIMKSQLIHSREITSLASKDDRLYSSSLDGHFKAYDINLRVINDLNLKKPLIGFIFSDTSDYPFLFTETGQILGLKKEEAPKIKSYRDRHTKFEEEMKVNHISRLNRDTNAIERMLSNFEYKKALITCFTSTNLEYKYTILNYLSQKRVFMRALQDGDTGFVNSVLELSIELLSIDEFISIIVEILTILVSVYSNLLVDNEDLRNKLLSLSDNLNSQVAFEEMYLRVFSFLESFQHKEVLKPLSQPEEDALQ